MQFLTILVFETSENVQFNIILSKKITLRHILVSFRFFLFLSIFLVSVFWFPLILVKDSKLFLNVWREVTVFLYQVLLLFSFEIVNGI